MIGIIGKKLGMTQIFDENGQQIPVTVVEATPNPVVQVIDRVAVGYASVQLGWGEQRVARESATKESAARPKSGRARKSSKERTPRGRRAAKAAVGHAAKAGLNAPPKVLCSFRLDDAPGKNPEIPTFSIGDRITVELFSAGDQVKVTGTTKGRGFQGVVKRHGFAGGPNTHGSTKHRRPGSIGPGTDPSRVIKGKKMPGHFGAERATQTHLRVERVDAARNLIYIRGAIPGARNGIVTVRKQG